MSDELRAAAERLLALADKASAGPWKCNVDVFDEGDIQVCVQDDAIRSLFCADSGIQPTAQVSWADAKLTQTYRDGEFVAAACVIGPQIARAYLAEHPEPPAFTRDGVEALRRAAREIDTDAVCEFRGEPDEASLLAAAERLRSNWYDAYGATEEGLPDRLIDDVLLCASSCGGLLAERDRFRAALGRLLEGTGSDDAAVWVAALKFASDVWVELTSPDEASDR